MNELTFRNFGLLIILVVLIAPGLDNVYGFFAQNACPDVQKTSRVIINYFVVAERHPGVLACKGFEPAVDLLNSSPLH